MLLFHSLMIHGDTYNVGDEKGWTFRVQNWPSGKSFKEGDILGTNVYESGADKIRLVKGMNYFICGVGRHCVLGMKIAVYAN
ncbi:chemocyanin-like [Trifolium pratense]|uniref:chemocyanin-like n=1 Tax=Trifolium pratense TaxID=57577 RepID=UPI001E6912B2|nr:chemocyanin-like [Trifolium pratense]